MSGQPVRKRDPFGESFCRRCAVPLMTQNARVSRGRFIGACRACESEEARARAERARGQRFGSRYTDSRRKYPVPLEDRRVS